MTRDFSAENRDAWNLVAEGKFAPELERDVESLRNGGTSLLPPELEMLGPLVPKVRRALHLQCSHGQDALSLWKLGAREVVGLDFSPQMLALARRKSELLGAPATFHEADVLNPPAELERSADLVYTGKGALYWVSDLARWADVVTRMLAPGGHFFIHEGHPLNWIWEPDVRDLAVRADADYFARAARVNRDFPGKWLDGSARAGESPKRAHERQWTLGEIVTELSRAGLALVTLREHPQNFWPQFPFIPAERAERVPQSFSLLMRRA